MRVALTGASGFIGNYVLAELEKRSIETIVLLRKGGRLPKKSRSDSVEIDIHKPHNKLFELIGRPDALIHLAWSGLPNYRSLTHIESELPAQYNFLSNLIKDGLQNILVAGTCFEYGMQSGPLDEEMVVKPSTPYGYAKNSLYGQINFLKQAFPFNFTWARLFYVFGEGQAPNSLYSQLRMSVESGDSYFKMSGGEQLRDYLPVVELAELLVKLSLIKRDAGVVNVCSGIPVSVRTLVEKWIGENDWKISLKLGYYPYPDYEPLAFWGGRNKLDSLLT